jgi:hypothetical protein
VRQSAEEVVRRLTIAATCTGVDQQTASLNKLADASNTLATATDTNAKRALSAEAAYNRQTLSLVPDARAQIDQARANKTPDSALAQGFITQDDHAKRIDENLINKLKQPQIAIDKTRSAASTLFATAFGSATLEGEKQFAVMLRDIAKTFKQISDYISSIPDWVKNLGGAL